MTATLMTISAIQAELNQELRAFAERMPVEIVRPSWEEAIAAVKPIFPELIGECDSAQALLDEMGLPVIEDMSRTYDPKRISWSIAVSEKDAIAQLEAYRQQSFIDVRDNLKIDYHWVFWVPDRDLYQYTDDALIEGSGDFRAAGRPKCWILDRFR